MKSKCKKLMSAAVVSAIIAAQTLMPVAAAGGTIDADMSTKSPVLRVAVPTKMAVSVNEFEMGDTGSQITSGEFTMKNMSEIPVNVKVTSEAVVGADTTLVSTKAAAEDSKDAEKPAMWLAAVAAVAENTGKLEYTTKGDKTVADLEGTEGNITAFGKKDTNNKSEVVQNFYLKEATAAIYKGITGDEVTAEKANATATIGGADFYELEEVTSTITSAALAEAEAKKGDLFTVAAAPVSGTPQALTRIKQGTLAASITLAAKVYKLKDTPTEAANLDASKMYAYIDSATTAAGDAAGFRYIGALSKAKSGWSTSDLSNITLTYDIVGISGSAYDGIASGLTYGYKIESSKISITSTGEMTVQGVSGANYQSGSLTLDGTEYPLDSKAGNWKSTEEPAVWKFSTAWTNNIKGKEVTVKIVLKDTTTIEEKLTVPAE